MLCLYVYSGKGAPKNLPNVPMLNAEPKLEGDGTSLVGHGEQL